MNTFEAEVKSGERFEFGKNWQSFLSTLSEEEIHNAEDSIKSMLKITDLDGKTFLDIGSGSGLFSLAARNLGATVHSFDFDPTSVACTKELRSRFYPDDPDWVIEEGSVLDETYINSLGKNFDIVYSWGVLHHTGNMWIAINNATSLVRNEGTIFIALYNDQGLNSKFWKRVKKIYCSGILGKWIMVIIFMPYFFLRLFTGSILRKKNLFSEYKKNRGMSFTHDVFDWLGGYPFEVAKVEEVFHFFRERKFVLENIKTTNGLGNNHFVFARETS